MASSALARIRRRSRTAILVLPLFLNCSAPADALLRIVPNLSPEIASHLLRDDPAAFRRFARRFEARALIDARVNLLKAPPVTTPEFTAIEAILAPHLRTLTSLLSEDFGIEREVKHYEAYLRRSLSDRIAIVSILQEVARLAYGSPADLGERAAKYESVIESSKPFQDVIDIGDQYGPYSELLPRLDREDEIAGCLELATRYTLDFGDTAQACQFLGVLGVLHQRAGNDSAKRAAWDRGLILARSARSWQEARILSFYGTESFHRGDPARGAEMLCRAENLCRELGAHESDIRFLQQKLRLFSKLSCWEIVDRDLQRADVLLRRGRSRWSKAEKSLWSVRIELLRMSLLAATGFDNQAVRMARHVLKSVESWPIDPRRESAVVDAATVLLRFGHTEEALSLSREASERCRRFEIAEILPEWCLIEAEARLELGDLTGCGKALEAFQSQTPRDWTPFDGRKSRRDELEIRWTWKSGDRSGAATKLASILTSIEGDTRPADATPEDLLLLGSAEGLRSLFHEIYEDSPGAGYAFEVAWTNLNSAGRRLPDDRRPSTVVRNIAAGRIPDPPPIPRGTVHCVFYRQENAIVRWSRSAARVSREVLPVKPPDLDGRIEPLLAAFSGPARRHGTLDRDTARQLHDLALILLPDDILDSAGSARLLVTDNGCLSGLPVEVLNLSPESYEPLLLAHDVAYLRCFRDWNSPARLDRETGVPDETLIVTDPRYDGDETRRLSILNEILPFSLEEALAISRTVDHPRLLRGAWANRREILEHWGKAASIYLATHVVNDPEMPYRTLIPLAGDGRNHHLAMEDVRRADLSNCELVVLSGCRTGVRYRTGRVELPSLGESFLDAGAGVAVLTWWNIGDENGALVMHEFNDRRAADESDPVEALCDARRELIRNGVTPQIWAAYSIAIAEQSLPEEREGADSAWIPAR